MYVHSDTVYPDDKLLELDTTGVVQLCQLTHLMLVMNT